MTEGTIRELAGLLKEPTPIPNDTRTDAPDPPGGHAIIASVFDILGTWACLHGAQLLFCSRTPKGIAIRVCKK